MTHINKDQMDLGNLGGKLFSYNIKYTQKEGIENPDQVQFSGKNVKAKYNGNIAEVDWRAVETLGVNPSSTPKRYGYAYDNLNRLTAGYYQNPNNPNSKENTESLDYDLNGNITNLYRTSVISYGTNTATVIDNLSYAYAEGGNKLTGITDSSQNQTGYENYPPTYPINYDLNGNMLSMYGKGISSIHYNFLNLPNEIYMGFYSPFYVSHMYRADGSKLRKNTVSTVSGFHNATVTTEITDYLDGFQYKNTKMETLGGGPDIELLLAAPVETRKAMEMEAFSLEDLIEPANPGIINPMGGIIAKVKTQDLQFFPTAEGFYDYQKNQYIYQYKDHLGNNRVSFARNSAGVLEITDANDYYPFGMNHLKTGNAFFGGSYKAYKYNGKELQESGMYDYGARFYMPDIGRWGVVDELAEKSRRFSTYTYALDNPIMFVDPDGREAQQCCGKLWNMTKAYYSGLYQGAKGTVQGTVNFVRHPINSTKSMATAMAKDPIGTQTNMLKSVAKTFSPMASAASIGYTAATKGVHEAGKEAGADLTQKTIDIAVAGTLKGAGNLMTKGTTGSTKLYRGVNSTSPGYENALEGIAKPRGGSASPLEHNTVTTESNYTSWTSNMSVAENFGLRTSGEGVVLTAEIPNSQLVQSPNLKSVNLIQSPGTIVSESETLVRGSVSGANVRKVNLDR